MIALRIADVPNEYGKIGCVPTLMDNSDDETCSTNSTIEAYEEDGAGGCSTSNPHLLDLLDPRCLPDLLEPSHLVSVLDGCLRTDYVRGCVVETWDTGLSEHLEAIAHLVLYQTTEHTISQMVCDQLTELSTALRPIDKKHPACVDAVRVYGTLRSAAHSLLATHVDLCCRQNMCRAVGLAVVALRSSTRPVFSVENFLVEINSAANFANLYCTAFAKRICAVLKEIYDVVMAGDYHPTNVVVQMAVMEKSIKAALETLADNRATSTQKTNVQRALLDELSNICTTIRMKNYGSLDSPITQMEFMKPPTTQSIYFTMSPWRSPITMYHQKSGASIDQLIKSSIRLIEVLVAELFKPCLGKRNRRWSK